MNTPTYHRDLDAYGRMDYCVSWSDASKDAPEDVVRGTMMRCLDFVVSQCGRWVQFHDVVITDDYPAIAEQWERQFDDNTYSYLYDRLSAINYTMIEYLIWEGHKFTKSEVEANEVSIKWWRRDILKAYKQANELTNL